MKTMKLRRLLPPFALWIGIVTVLTCVPLKKVEAKPWLTAYVGSWWFNWDDNGVLPMKNIDFNGMTVCDYMAINPAGTSPFIDTTNNYYVNMIKLTNMAHAAGVKCILTCGSWQTETNFLIATKPSNLPIFVDSLTTFVKSHGFDGVDIDWEPFTVADSARWTNMIIALRKALPSPKYLITVTAGNGYPYGVYAAAQQYIDRIDIMTYDLGYPAGGYSSIYAAAIYSCGHVDPFDNKTPVASCNWLVQNFEKAGVTPSKIGIGCEPGGEYWPGITGAYQSIANVPTAAFKLDISYNTVMAAYYEPNLYHWDAGAKAAYLSYTSPTDSSADWFLSYDDTTALKAKLAYVDSAGIGGLFIYEIGMSYDKTSGDNLFLDVTQHWLEGASAVKETGAKVPSTVVLTQNYPNPFNPTTTIGYYVPKRGDVSLTVYNVLGEKVATLYSGFQTPGNHTAFFDGADLASGVYFYELRAGNVAITKKLVLMK